MLLDRVVRDPWLPWLAVAGALLLAVHAIAGLPWVLWVAWSYLVGLTWVEVVSDVRHVTRLIRA